jgi:hypothetical protein
MSDSELCTQNCASFADVLKDERAASFASMIRNHAAQCKINGWAVPSPNDSYGWMSELLPEHPGLYEYEGARALEYVRAEKEEWEGYARAEIRSTHGRIRVKRQEPYDEGARGVRSSKTPRLPRRLIQGKGRFGDGLHDLVQRNENPVHCGTQGTRNVLVPKWLR